MNLVNRQIGARTYELHIPTNLGEDPPLIVACHGGEGNSLAPKFAQLAGRGVLLAFPRASSVAGHSWVTAGDNRKDPSVDIRAWLIAHPAEAVGVVRDLPVVGPWERHRGLSQRRGPTGLAALATVTPAGWAWTVPDTRHSHAPTREEAETAADAVLREAGVALAGEE